MRIAIKLGGSVLEIAHTRAALIRQIAEVRAGGADVILIHGGGKGLNRRLGQLGISSRFLDGLRVTDEATLSTALMVLAGEVNKSLVLELASSGVRPFGFCGADGLSVRCVKASEVPGFPAGLGFVGKPVSAERQVFDLLLGAGLTPVVASIAVGDDHHAYNVNADQMASVCAWSTGCETLIYLTDVAGVMDAGGTVLPRLDQTAIRRLRGDGVIAGGMLPKTEACLEALARGVSSVYILPGSAPDILRKFLSGSLTEGTKIDAAA